MQRLDEASDESDSNSSLFLELMSSTTQVIEEALDYIADSIEVKIAYERERAVSDTAIFTLD